MGVISSFNSLDKRFAWSFLGFMLAAIFGGISIYTEFFRVNTPSVVVEVISDANVLDVKEEISELKVFYGDVDIKSLNQTLSVLFLRIKNDGGAPILNGYYDKNYPFNIILKEGKFLKVEQLGATNDYLRTAAQPKINTDKTISLPDVILEPSEGYTIKILALHSSGHGIKIDVVGKIAGTKKIELRTLNSAGSELSFWGGVFYGSIFVQLVRLPIYFVVFIFVLVSIVGPMVMASDAISTRKRKKVVEQYKVYSKDCLSNYHEVIFKEYIDLGLPALVEVKELLTDKRNWKRLVREVNMDVDSTESLLQSPAARLMIEQEDVINLTPNYIRRNASRLIRKIGALSKSEDNEISIDEDVESGLSKFIDFVVIKEG
ncbi:hypothetical protein [Shewanella sedimentimangrovi]|uniref:Uncharacterized protein n=1 Tax=Shewanella sedimentimangrovi TaxID=2814293 RepID=A0ABX7R445_9GAMM|nr:hypothetical protein [Shewanella sedimentimangrovi]QSX37860.1 hypothetical protein JYB85_03190 [Shewanella sedimentimangrovi]